MKKLFTLFLVTVLVLSMASCGGTGTSEKKDDKKQEEKKTDAKKEEKQTEAKQEDIEHPFYASEKPLELTIFEFLHKPYNSDYPVNKKAAEFTNVTLKSALSQSASNNKEAFSLMVASGEMADIVCWDKSAIEKIALEGAFVPLDELIEENAPNIKAFFEEHPEIKNHATAADGKIYTIPFIPDGDAAEGWFIRKDWLEKLGLEEPKNAQELHDVLLAFKEKDPNGNGKQDEVPFFSRINKTRTVFADFGQLWGAKEDWYVEDGVVKFGPNEEAYKEAYTNLAQWYKEGLIDSEIYTRGKKARDIMLKENLGGMTHDWFASTSSYNTKVDIEGFKFHPFAPPADINGKVYERTRRNHLHWSAWGISVTNPDPVATIKYFDFFFTEEGRILMNYGIEGETYTMVDGKPTLTDVILKADQPVVKLKEYGAQIPIGFHQDFEYEKQFMNPIAFDGVKLYTDKGYFSEQFPALPYTPEEKKRIGDLMVAIQTLQEETAQGWLLGSSDPQTTYDAFKQSMMEFGLEEAIEIQQTAYDRYLEKLGKK